MTSALWTHLFKDLRIEWRSREAINSMLFFALLVVVLFSLAFDPRGAFSVTLPAACCAGYHVRFGERAQPGLGARDPSPGAGRAAHAPTPGSQMFLAKVLANFLFRVDRAADSGAVFLVFYTCTFWECVAAALVLPLQPGRWWLTERSLPLSRSTAATANCCCRCSVSISACVAGHGELHNRHFHR